MQRPPDVTVFGAWDPSIEPISRDDRVNKKRGIPGISQTFPNISRRGRDLACLNNYSVHRNAAREYAVIVIQETPEHADLKSDSLRQHPASKQAILSIVSEALIRSDTRWLSRMELLVFGGQPWRSVFHYGFNPDPQNPQKSLWLISLRLPDCRYSVELLQCKKPVMF